MSITRCPHCGTANRAGSNFCNGCGTELRDSSPPPQEPPAGEETAPASTPPSFSAATPPEREEPEQPPPAPPVSDAFADQPWLRLEFAGDEESLDADLGADPDTDLDEEAALGEGGRLITAIQGLLTPIRIATNISDNAPLPPTRVVPTVDELSNDQLRLIRGLMSEQPALVNYQVRPALRPPRPLRVPWIFALLGLAVGLPALLFLAGPVGEPNRWSGVEDAYLTIQGVAPDTLVVVYWAYDPATAGEIDLAMQPVMRHLLQRRARLAVITTTPGGIGSAERLIAQVRTSQGSGNLALAADLGQPITFAYLPGGAASLPLLARDPALGLLENIMVVSPEQREALVTHPALVVAAAAQAEDVQHWLEQVQALAHTPVIAVTAAGADPILRPYWDSSQLSGLVSGFDGAYAYRRLLDPFVAPENSPALLRQIVLQNWGHFALLAAIALGNLAALLSRESGP
ncbi:MAG: zinc ribbon domain-containing protein [Caldilineaceae bacterium]|nr:zinc ribbon domain-containing protein [Caldilineaceae bacterium]